MVFAESVRESLPGLFLFLLVLPLFSTLVLVLQGDRRRRQVFNLAAWGMATGIGLTIGVSSYPRLFWVRWGVWFYIGLAAGAVTLEVLTLAAGTGTSPG